MIKSDVKQTHNWHIDNPFVVPSEMTLGHDRRQEDM